MRFKDSGRKVLIASVLAAVCHGAAADDWSNSGGNAGRNGLSAEIGPDAPDDIWSGGRPSIIAWQPVIEGDRVFMVRQTGFPPGGEPKGSPVVAMDLNTGDELWAVDIPFEAGDWTTWVAGVKDGRVYASRSGNGASVSAKLYALDAATGDVLWMSDDEIDAGAYDGVVFAPDGDPIIGSFRTIWRINAEDGATVWDADRLCSVSGNCGVARSDDAVYAADAAPGGNVVKRFDLETGAFEYAGPTLVGFLFQNTPMVAPDGTIYLPRVQNNANTDFFYAMDDDGSAITVRWFVRAAYSTSSEFAVAPDGSVYMIAPGNIILRLDQANGAVLADSAPIPADFLTPRMAVDAEGRLFFSNGAFSNGRFYSFNPDLTERWSVPVPNLNIGAPALGQGGTLVVAGVGTNIRAYRTDRACPADWNGDTAVNSDDFFAFLEDYFAGDADFNNDTVTNSDDFFAFLTAFFEGCR